MQKLHKKMIVAALLLAVLVMASGCTTNNTPVVSPGPTAQPMPTLSSPVATTGAMDTTSPNNLASPAANAATLDIMVDGKTLADKGIDQGGVAWLPLKSTAEALGYQVKESDTGTGADTGMTLNITPQGANASPIQMTYKVSDNTITEASVAKTGMTQTLANPLMMVDTTLYASQEVFTTALGAKVDYAAPATKVTVTKGAATP